MKRKEFDNLLLKQIGDKHIKQGTVYYDDTYAEVLKKHLEEEGLNKKYSQELKENSKGIKMCSIGSSSRFCYLSSKGLFKDISEFEKNDLKNGCCRPHYDGYSKLKNTFYEFKSHELCDESHRGFSNSYIPLLKEVFNIETDDSSKLCFSDFGINFTDNPLITKINFDFKQFICHILGLFAHIKKTNEKPKLLYVWVTPDISGDEKDEINSFVEFIKKQIEFIFSKFKELNINFLGKKVRIEEIIDLNYNIISALEIEDYILKEIDV